MPCSGEQECSACVRFCGQLSKHRAGWETQRWHFKQARVCADKEEKAELKGKSIVYKLSWDSPQEKEKGRSKKLETGFFHQSPQRTPSLKSQRLETKQVYHSSWGEASQASGAFPESLFNWLQLLSLQWSLRDVGIPHPTPLGTGDGTQGRSYALWEALNQSFISRPLKRWFYLHSPNLSSRSRQHSYSQTCLTTAGSRWGER